MAASVEVLGGRVVVVASLTGVTAPATAAESIRKPVACAKGQGRATLSVDSQAPER